MDTEKATKTKALGVRFTDEQWEALNRLEEATRIEKVPLARGAVLAMLQCFAENDGFLPVPYKFVAANDDLEAELKKRREKAKRAHS